MEVWKIIFLSMAWVMAVGEPAVNLPGCMYFGWPVLVVSLSNKVKVEHQQGWRMFSCSFVCWDGKLVFWEKWTWMYISDLFGWWGRKGIVRLYLQWRLFFNVVCFGCGIGWCLADITCILGYSYLERVCWETIGDLLFLTAMLQNYWT